jgi:hypothetical protein
VTHLVELILAVILTMVTLLLVSVELANMLVVQSVLVVKAVVAHLQNQTMLDPTLVFSQPTNALTLLLAVTSVTQLETVTRLLNSVPLALSAKLVLM